MGFISFLIAVILGTGLAYGTGRKPVLDGLYAGIAFAVAMLIVHTVTKDVKLAFLVAVPVGLGASFIAPKADAS